MSKFDHGLFSNSSYRDASGTTRTGILTIGGHIKWPTDVDLPDEIGEIAYSEFHELTEQTFSALAPVLIFSPVVAPTFDCIDVATILRDLGYGGSYRALSSPLPNPGIIRREIRALCPDLDFDVILVERGAAAARRKRR